MLRIVLLLSCVSIGGCGVRPQPESAETVAAYEIPLPTKPDRQRFLAILSRESPKFGFHVDAASEQELKAIALPGAENSISATVWRGEDDDEPIASVMDFNKPGFAWLTFIKGKNLPLNKEYRNRVMEKIGAHWPETLTLPIMPNGGIPLPDDMQKTESGYVIKPSAASTYAIGN